MNKTYSFTFVLEGPDPTEQANLDRLFEAGCSDATFGERDGVYIADFDRKASSFSGALKSAMTAIEKAVPGMRVVRVEPEDLVTASEIASRTKRSRESVRLLFEGKRGKGSFPRPVAWLADRTRLWQWSRVEQWFAPKSSRRTDAQFIAVTNAFLMLRDVARQRNSTQSNDHSLQDVEKLILEDRDLRSWLTSVVAKEPAGRRR